MTIKVAHVITRLDLGGAQQNTLHTVRALDRSRFDPLLICGEGGYFDADVRRDPSVRAVFVSPLVREVAPARDLLALFELANLFRAERPDFDVQHGAYETYPVLMAQRIEAWCREQAEGSLVGEAGAIAAVTAFRALDHDAQARVLHADEPDNGISGASLTLVSV